MLPSLIILSLFSEILEKTIELNQECNLMGFSPKVNDQDDEYKILMANLSEDEYLSDSSVVKQGYF